MSSLYLIGAIQTLFLALLILTKRRKQLSDTFLTAFILTMGLRLFFIYLRETTSLDTYPQYALLEFAYWPLFGPLLYLYIVSITAEVKKFKLIYLIHFIPAITVWLAYSELIFNIRNIPFEDFKPHGIFFKIGKYVWFFTTHVYFLLSIVKLHMYRYKIKNYFSYKKQVDLKWLMILTNSFGVFLFVMLFFALSKETYEFPEFVNHLVWLIMVVYIFGIGFYGYKQKGIFSDYDENLNEQSEKENFVIKENIQSNCDEKKVKSIIGNSESKKLADRLEHLMKNEKPFIDSNLNIRSLALRLDTTSHKLSFVINNIFLKNFYEYINCYRIEEAKKLLADPNYSNEKIMSIAYDCGFTSKSTFFSSFRKYTHSTPSEFRMKTSEI